MIQIPNKQEHTGKWGSLIEMGKTYGIGLERKKSSILIEDSTHIMLKN
jgi:hypothetical protein